MYIASSVTRGHSLDVIVYQSNYCQNSYEDECAIKLFHGRSKIGPSCNLHGCTPCFRKKGASILLLVCSVNVVQS